MNIMHKTKFVRYHRNCANADKHGWLWVHLGSCL